MIPCSTSPGMRNSDGAKSPTVRLQISSPCASSARTSAAILRISEPSSEPVRLESRGWFILKYSWRPGAVYRFLGQRLDGRPRACSCIPGPAVYRSTVTRPTARGGGRLGPPPPRACRMRRLEHSRRRDLRRRRGLRRVHPPERGSASLEPREDESSVGQPSWLPRGRRIVRELTERARAQVEQEDLRRPRARRREG